MDLLVIFGGQHEKESYLCFKNIDELDLNYTGTPGWTNGLGSKLLNAMYSMVNNNFLKIHISIKIQSSHIILV